MKLSTTTLRTCLVALDNAYEREESVTAKLRISNASREISEVLAAGPDVAQSTVREDWDHLPTPTGTGPFTGEQLFGNQLGDQQNGALIKVCRECGCLSASDTKHVEWHNKVADL